MSLLLMILIDTPVIISIALNYMSTNMLKNVRLTLVAVCNVFVAQAEYEMYTYMS